MQTLSRMRRDFTYNRYLKLFFLALILIVYQIFASVYAFLSPLVGLFFVYLVARFKDESLEVYLAFLYLCFFELNQGFYLFSIALVFFIYYYLVRPKIASMFDSNVWINSIAVICAYAGLYLSNLFFAYLLNASAPDFSVFYLFYIVIDAILANILIKSER